MTLKGIENLQTYLNIIFWGGKGRSSPTEANLLPSVVPGEWLAFSLMANAIVIVLAMAVTIETAGGIRNKQMTANVTQTLDYLLASDRYDKRLRPGFGGSPVTISVNFFIKSMGPVSDNDQSFGLDCYFRQHWYDLRLRYQKFPGLEEFSMSWLFLDRVWKPDTYFVNGKRSFLHRITVPNKFLRLRHDGFITYSMRLTITASCPMYLRKFPLDAQRCPLVLGSYGYTNKDVVYEWTDDSPIGLQQGVEIAQFDLINITTENEKTMIKGGLSYSTVKADFWLKRHTGYFMLQVYVPCGLIVLSSWVSFWIDPDDVAARVALGVTTVLSLTTMGFGGRAQLPKVSYWTALDWFVIICFTSVFSVMIEYAVVNFIDKFKKDIRKMMQRRKEEEEVEKRAVETEPKPKPVSPRRKTRSSSFSFSPPKELQTIVQVEPRPSRQPPQKVSTTVVAYFHEPTPTQRSKSIPNLKIEPPKANIEDLIDPEAEMEPVQVILDVQEGDGSEWETDGAKKRTFDGFLKKGFWPKIKIKIPDRTKLISFAEGPDPPDKFSRIDVQARRSFPIAFLLSLILYLFAFSYYLTDDIPTRSSVDGY